MSQDPGGGLGLIGNHMIIVGSFGRVRGARICPPIRQSYTDHHEVLTAEKPMDNVNTAKHAPTRALFLREKLTEEIVSGVLAPGSRLDEQEIANRFGVSRTPVREAVRHLVASGLAESQPNRSAVVAPMNTVKINELFDALTELDIACGRLAACRMTQADREKLLLHHRNMRGMLLGDPELYSDMDFQFHEIICRGSDNHFLIETAQRLRARLAPIQRLRLTMLLGARQSFAEHDRIVSAILAGDAISCEVAMRAHSASSPLMLEQISRERIARELSNTTAV